MVENIVVVVLIFSYWVSVVLSIKVYLTLLEATIVVAVIVVVDS